MAKTRMLIAFVLSLATLVVSTNHMVYGANQVPYQCAGTHILKAAPTDSIPTLFTSHHGMIIQFAAPKKGMIEVRGQFFVGVHKGKTLQWLFFNFDSYQNYLLSTLPVSICVYKKGIEFDRFPRVLHSWRQFVNHGASMAKTYGILWYTVITRKYVRYTPITQ